MGIKAKIASLVVDLSANSASYNNELKKSKQNTHAWAKDVKKYAKMGAAALATASVGAAFALAKLTSEAMQSADALAKHADKIGMSTEALAGLRHQAELNGVAQRALDVGLQRMVRRVSEAAQGTGVASAALYELGINAQELNRLSPDKQFSKIADAMAKVNTQSDRVRLGFKLFDSEGVGLINSMRDGAAGIAAARQEADLLGITISRIDAAKIEAANDAVYRSDQVWKGLGNTMAIAVSPFITAMKTDFVESAKAANGYQDQVASGMKVVSKAVGFAGNAVRGMQVIWKAAQLGVATFIATALYDLSLLQNKLGEIASYIPGFEFEIDPNTGISGMAQAAQHQVGVLKTELSDLATKKLPSQSIDEYFQKIQSEAQAAAEKVAAVATKLGTTTPSSSEESTDNTASFSDFSRVKSELARVNESVTEAYQRRQEIIDAALQEKQISEENHQKISSKNWSKHQAEIVKIEAGRNKARIASGKQFFGDLATLSESGSKTLAAIGKASAKINIVIGTIEAAQNAYTHASKWGGPIAGAAAAAAATIAGMVRYNAVDSAGSSSSAPGGLAGSTTFDQQLPNSAANLSNVAPLDSSSRKEIIYKQEITIHALDGADVQRVLNDNRDTILDINRQEMEETGVRYA